MLTVNLADGVRIEDGILNIRGSRVTRLQLNSEIGRGANGVVFDAKHIHLDRTCAVKIWLRLRAGDNRDKLVQGIEQARKLAASHPDWVAQCYDSDVISDVFFASMELIPGQALRTYLQRPLQKRDLWWLARLYLNGITKTTTEYTAHGDAHVGNVLVYEHIVSDYEKGTRLKFIDFGTSIFLGGANWRERHWRVVEETMMRILAGFNGLSDARKTHGPFPERPEYLKIPYWEDILFDLSSEAQK